MGSWPSMMMKEQLLAPSEGGELAWAALASRMAKLFLMCIFGLLYLFSLARVDSLHQLAWATGEHYPKII